jgi:predicted TIM-barrel fold metal-dependent hydrolase
MHLRSRAVYEATLAMCGGRPGCQVPDAAHAVLGAADVLDALDDAHAGRGVVLSMAYLFGSPYLVDAHYDVARMTREENEYLAGEVARSHGRLVGFFSVDPLSRSALEEVRHWEHDGRLTGLKLHLTSAGMSFKDPTQVKQVAAIVRLAGERRLPMVIHLRSGWEFGAAETEVFIRDILPAARDSTVQIAHAGGWSGTDRVMLEDLGTFGAHIARDDPATRHVLFDLSGVVTEATTPEEAAALVALMRRTGITRFVMGSDYDFATPRVTDKLSREKLPLSDEEWRTLAQSCAPWAC